MSNFSYGDMIENIKNSQFLELLNKNEILDFLDALGSYGKIAYMKPEVLKSQISYFLKHNVLCVGVKKDREEKLYFEGVKNNLSYSMSKGLRDCYSFGVLHNGLLAKNIANLIFGNNYINTETFSLDFDSDDFSEFSYMGLNLNVASRTIGSKVILDRECASYKLDNDMLVLYKLPLAANQVSLPQNNKDCMYMLNVLKVLRKAFSDIYIIAGVLKSEDIKKEFYKYDSGDVAVIDNCKAMVDLKEYFCESNYRKIVNNVELNDVSLSENVMKALLNEMQKWVKQEEIFDITRVSEKLGNLLKLDYSVYSLKDSIEYLNFLFPVFSADSLESSESLNSSDEYTYKMVRYDLKNKNLGIHFLDFNTILKSINMNDVCEFFSVYNKNSLWVTVGGNSIFNRIFTNYVNEKSLCIDYIDLFELCKRINIDTIQLLNVYNINTKEQFRVIEGYDNFQFPFYLWNYNYNKKGYREYEDGPLYCEIEKGLDNVFSEFWDICTLIMSFIYTIKRYLRKEKFEDIKVLRNNQFVSLAKYVDAKDFVNIRETKEWVFPVAEDKVEVKEQSSENADSVSEDNGMKDEDIDVVLSAMRVELNKKGFISKETLEKVIPILKNEETLKTVWKENRELTVIEQDFTLSALKNNVSKKSVTGFTQLNRKKNSDGKYIYGFQIRASRGKVKEFKKNYGVSPKYNNAIDAAIIRYIYMIMVKVEGVEENKEIEEVKPIESIQVAEQNIEKDLSIIEDTENIVENRMEEVQIDDNVEKVVIDLEGKNNDRECIYALLDDLFDINLIMDDTDKAKMVSKIDEDIIKGWICSRLTSFIGKVPNSSIKENLFSIGNHVNQLQKSIQKV